MGLARSLPELEDSLAGRATACEVLTDRDYQQLIARWQSIFRPLVESRSRRLSGARALEATRAKLPQTVLLFSGVRIPEVANHGGRGPVAYRAVKLASFDAELARQLELVLVAEDFSWSCVFSHESGSMVHEELYELPGFAA